MVEGAEQQAPWSNATIIYDLVSKRDTLTARVAGMSTAPRALVIEARYGHSRRSHTGNITTYSRRSHTGNITTYREVILLH